MDTLDRYIKIALSDKQVLKLVHGKANIVLYPELIYYDNIDQILGRYGACFLLFESKPNYGHWTCLIRRGNTIEFFDPYSGYPDDNLKFVPEEFKHKSNQDKPYLSMLLLNSPYKLEYNEFDFQNKKQGVNTCGRWCAMRILFKYLTIEEFASLFLNKNGDKMVTYLTMWVNITNTRK